MTTIITIILHVLITALFARIEAHEDYGEISNGEYIDHRRSWLYRAAIMGCVSAGAMIALRWNFHWTVILGFILMSAFGFSAVFRSRLNRLRGLSPWYLSPSSNMYDGTIYYLSCAIQKASSWIGFGARSIKTEVFRR